MMKNVAINETGISIKGRNAIDQSLKNKKIIMITKTTEIANVSATSTTDFLMKTVLSKAMSNLISLGKSFFNLSISA